MFWNKKGKTIEQIQADLKKNPDTVFICTEFMTLYAPGLSGFLMIPGDYTNVSKEEVQKIINRQYAALIARNN